jgi:hypothetical protein
VAHRGLGVAGLLGEPRGGVCAEDDVGGRDVAPDLAGVLRADDERAAGGHDHLARGAQARVDRAGVPGGERLGEAAERRRLADQGLEPLRERGERRVRRPEIVRARDDRGVADVDHLRDQIFARREVAIQGADADPGAARDRLERGGGALLAEHGFGGGDERIVIAARVGACRPGEQCARRGCRRSDRCLAIRGGAHHRLDEIEA